MARFNERQVVFYRRGGHNHNGENSSPIELAPGSVKYEHLHPDLAGSFGGGGGGSSSSSATITYGGANENFTVPDLEIVTPPIAAGSSFEGSALWVGLCFVRLVRVEMSADTEATVTFYHKGTYADEDREFRATNIGKGFMWEGIWAHYDETDTKNIFFKVDNTGVADAAFKITVKSGTTIANNYATFVEAIVFGGEEFSGKFEIKAGSGISIEKSDNGILISAAPV